MCLYTIVIEICVLAVLVCAFVCVKLGCHENSVEIVKHITDGGYTTVMHLNDAEEEIRSILEEDCSCLCLYQSERTIHFLRFSALSEIPNIISPDNISEENVADFADTFEINYLYSSDENLVQIFQSAFAVTNAGVPHLYRIEKSD